MPDLTSVLLFLNTCRQTHIEWRDRIRDNPEAALEPAPRVAIAGDIQEHEECIAGYDEVIELIMRLSQARLTDCLLVIK